MQVTTHTGIWSRQPLATLGKLTAAALFGSALAFATLLLTILLATGTRIGKEHLPGARGQPSRGRSLLAATGASMAGLSDAL